MSRKTTAALLAAMGINFALAGGALMIANLNKPAEFDIDAAFANNPSDLTEVAGIAVDASAGDLAVPLTAATQGGNTRVTFTCGKQSSSGREVHDGTWDQITGGVLYRPDSEALLAFQAVFDTRSLRTDTQALTNTVTSKEKWFDIDNHPLATFTCDTIKPTNAATPSHTHDLVGSFTLNGITQPITIPAKLTFAGQSVTIDAAFTILRSDFGVEKRESSLAGSVGGVVSKVEDEVELTVRVTASPDPVAVIAELATTIESQQGEMKSVRKELAQLQDSVRFASEQAAMVQDKLDSLRLVPAQQVDLSQLPGSYTDHAPKVTGPSPFEMVLVPGDEAAGIDAFYLARHEAHWEMLADWVYAADVGPDQASREIAAGLRPSPLWGTLAQQFQVSASDHPAMGMTRLTAQSYCKWLSKKTGRKYRLPTKDEWLYAMRLGGGVPEDLDAVSWHADNAELSDHNFAPVTSPCGEKKPNKLGIHDMFGSVAEWVTGTGDEHYVVGGSINTPPNEISATWRAVEDKDVWSASYPNLPLSRFWYVDYYYSGIRLVCEPASVAANPPAANE